MPTTFDASLCLTWADIHVTVHAYNVLVPWPDSACGGYPQHLDTSRNGTSNELRAVGYQTGNHSQTETIPYHSPQIL
ncbi:hypothetical protein Cob_v012082 [Colletotrichum orbiculare MAFF 240422]|uniref:Uncharacterized protein n=1 Tax=Colletotrichum orbiculare (strain 104-T / ATCC 96160 / CBS 514.97 / LARS 414 / MAFF 240422) TaxID=1213857 RepID=A0A484FDF7_COLOR|nr:hypothetical protein Cob_v012082 [Colletotrichum orbiculare MAFF 240422]